MSKFTNKAMMFAIIVSAGAGQVFAAEKDLPDPSKVGCWSCSWFSGFRAQARNVVEEVKKDAPVIQALGTTTIEIAKTIAAAKGDTKALDTLDTAQTVLNGAADVVAANDIHVALDLAEQTVLTVDPHAGKAVATLNQVVSQGETIATIVKPLIEVAVANTDATYT